MRGLLAVMIAHWTCPKIRSGVIYVGGLDTQCYLVRNPDMTDSDLMQGKLKATCGEECRYVLVPSFWVDGA